MVTGSSCGQSMGCFLSLPVYESSSVDECPAEALELIAFASGDWTPVSTVEVIFEPSNTLQSVSIAQLTEACKRQHWIFHCSSGFQMLFVSGFFVWTTSNIYIFNINLFILHIHYSCFNTCQKYILESLWHLRKSEDLFFVFLLLISWEIFATWYHSCIRLTTTMELNCLFVLAVLWRPKFR